jgi:hypothetical protein
MFSHHFAFHDVYLLALIKLSVIKNMKVRAILDSQILTFTFHYILANHIEYHILEANSFSFSSNSIQIKTCYLCIDQLPILQLPILKQVEAECIPPMIQLIHV